MRPPFEILISLSAILRAQGERGRPAARRL